MHDDVHRYRRFEFPGFVPQAMMQSSKSITMVTSSNKAGEWSLGTRLVHVISKLGMLVGSPPHALHYINM